MDKDQTPGSEDIFGMNQPKDDGRTEIDRELERVESIEATSGGAVGAEQDDGSDLDLPDEFDDEVEQESEPVKPEPKRISEIKPREDKKDTPEPKAIEPVKPAKPVLKPPKKPNEEALLKKIRHDMNKADAGSKNKSTLASTASVVLMILVILVLLGLCGWLYYQKMNTDNQLESANQRLAAAGQAQVTAPATTDEDAAAIAEAAKDSYKKLPWWNLRYKADDSDIETKLIVNADGSEKIGLYSPELVRMTTNRHLVAGSDEAARAARACGDDAYFATILRIKAIDVEVNGKLDPAKLKAFYTAESEFGASLYKKVGSNYYLVVDAPTVNGESRSCIPDTADYKVEQGKAKAISDYAKKVVQKLESAQN